MKKGTTYNPAGLDPRCTVCGSPQPLSYIRIGTMKIYVCGRPSCIRTWITRINAMEKVYRNLWTR